MPAPRSTSWRRAVAALLGAALVALLAGCGAASSVGAPAGDGVGLDPVAEAPVPSMPAEVVTADGSTVTVTDASRILPLWGNLSEVVFALGLGENVVGRDVSATFPGADDLPIVTRAHDVSTESVLSLEPTVVLAQTDTGPPEALDQIRAAGIPVVVLEMPASVDDITPRIRTIATALGVPDAGEELVERTTAEIDLVREAIPDGPRPRVAFLYLRGQAGVYLLGGEGSGADSMIAAAGGEDAGTAIGLDRPFTPITSEAMVEAAPDVLLLTGSGLESVGGIDELLAMPGIAQTPAAAERRVVTLEDGILYSFGSRTPAALAELIGKIHAARIVGGTVTDVAEAPPGPASRLPRGADGDDLEDVVATNRPRVHGPLLIGCLTVALVVVAVAAAAIGSFPVSPLEVLSSVLDRIGISVASAPTGVAESVLWEVRFPRVALALVVGAALGCAGAAMQGTFANPLAEPGIVGVSSGAAMGAVASIVVGFTVLGNWSLTLAAFLGGLLTVVVVYLASRANGRTEVVTLILTGIAVNALTGAVMGLLTYFSTDAQLRSITFWQLGSVAQATWPKVAAVAPLALLGVVLAVTQAPKLDLLSLGERSARHLGVDVERLRVRMLVVVAVLTAAAVAVSGIILFVGLVVPHLVRMVGGPSHRLLLVASALGGAVIVVGADLAARTIAAPAEIPLGVLTALVGSPFFFWLLRRTRARQGGWA